MYNSLGKIRIANPDACLWTWNHSIPAKPDMTFPPRHYNASDSGDCPGRGRSVWDSPNFVESYGGDSPGLDSCSAEQRAG